MDCDEYAPGYFLLKQEGAEPILVRKEPFKNTMEKGGLVPVKLDSVAQDLSYVITTSASVFPISFT